MTSFSRSARAFSAVLLIVAAAALAASALAPPAAPAGPQKKKSPPNEKNPQYQYEKGLIALRYGLTDEAIRYGQLALSLDPQHYNAWTLLGSAYYTKGDYQLSADAYEKALAIKPGAAEIQRNLGLAYVELKNTEKAQEVFKKAFELGGDEEAAFQLGRICYSDKRFDEALEYALKAIQKNPKSARAYNLKGVILNQLGRYLEAAGSFQAGLILAPDDIGLQVNLGIAYLNANEPQKAKAVLEAVLPKIKEDVLRSQVENMIKSIKDGGF